MSVSDLYRNRGVNPQTVKIAPKNNLCTNGDFETNTTGWYTDAGTISRETGTPLVGAGSLKLVAGGGWCKAAYMIMSGLTIGHTYYISGLMKSTAAAGRKANARIYDGAQHYGNAIDCSVAATPISMMYRGGATDANFYFELDGYVEDESFLLDSVVFYDLTAEMTTGILRYPTLISDANCLQSWEFQGQSYISKSTYYATTDTDMAYSAVNGRFGLGAGFNGSSSKIVVSAASGISGDAVLSYMAWIKPTTVTGLQVILDSGVNDVLRGFLVCINLNDVGDLGIAFLGGNNAFTAPNILVPGIWQHIAITKAAGAINTTLNLYVNGILIPLAGSPPTGTPNILNNALTIGYGTAIGGYYYGGAIDDLMYFNRVVTGKEISDYLAWCQGLT
jgi:hypothetical protein